MSTDNDGRTRLATSMLVGAVAGAAGVWVMDQVGWALYRGENDAAVRRELEARVDGKDVAHVAAGKIAGLVGKSLTPEQPHPAGIAVHYTLGIVPGALYGALRHRVPALTAGHGLAYGLGLFIVNDELLNPLLGLASGPAAYPWQAHARGLVAHLALGVATDMVLDVFEQAGLAS